MADPLTNSRRRFRTATLTPIELPVDDGPASGGQALVLGALVRNAGFQKDELVRLRQQAQGEADAAAIDAVARVADAATADQGLAAVQQLNAVPPEVLSEVVRRVQELREEAFADAVRTLAAAAAPAPPEEEGAHRSPATTMTLHQRTSGLAARSAVQVLDQDFAAPVRANVVAALNELAPDAPMVTRSYYSDLVVPLAEERVELVSHFWKRVKPYLPSGADEASLDPISALEEIDRRRQAGEVAINALQRRAVQPLGLLHLESLEMTPDGVERGELVYSLPMAPKEKVTLSHKEWAVRETELTDVVQDFLENYSERGVAETDEIAIATQTEHRQVDRNGGGTSNGVTLTAPADGGPGSSTVTNANSRQESRTHARSVTSMASARSVRDHKVSFTVATTAGSEDFTSRLLENPSEDHSMRIDYFRMMRRWQIELRRVGVRLTYDIVIPDPGLRLRSRQELLRRYDRALAEPFAFVLQPWDIDEDNWGRYAAAYGAVLTPPPDPNAPGTAFQQWQMQSFSTVRDAAFASHVQALETVRQRRAQLAREIDSGTDGPSLRRLEREQVMRSVMEWVFPGFGTATAPAGLGVSAGLSDDSWRQIMEYGEYIKYVHSAIDWSNLAYVLYPYFWSNTAGTSGMDKLYLDHPDPTHRDFLRAGACRVILPIQPSFESGVLSLLDQGRLGTLPNAHRFASVIDEVTAARAELEPLPGPDGALVDGGVTIGSWVEYTPTSALDLQVVTAAVT
ncbi:MAG: hypothetical protein JWQ45_2536 [Blastococcus sp.]|jgi:hypothetical protein|nr:hypothetical protein [Blastococcus sp.]